MLGRQLLPVKRTRPLDPSQAITAGNMPLLRGPHQRSQSHAGALAKPTVRWTRSSEEPSPLSPPATSHYLWACVPTGPSHAGADNSFRSDRCTVWDLRRVHHDRMTCLRAAHRRNHHMLGLERLRSDRRVHWYLLGRQHQPISLLWVAHGRNHAHAGAAATTMHTDAPPGTFTAITTAELHTCGVAHRWNRRLLGPTTIAGQVDAPAGSFNAVRHWRRMAFACGLRTDATITCWGSQRRRPELIAPPRSLHRCHGTRALAFLWAAHRRNHHMLGLTTTNGRVDAPSGTFDAQSPRANGTLAGCAPTQPSHAGDDNDVPVRPTRPKEPSPPSPPANGHHSCGLRTDATITCWGRNDDDQTDAPPGTFTAITTGGHHSCGLHTDATITCWGRNDEGQTDAPPGTFTAVTSGAGRSCGLRTDAIVICWGYYAPIRIN